MGAFEAAHQVLLETDPGPLEAKHARLTAALLREEFRLTGRSSCYAAAGDLLRRRIAEESASDGGEWREELAELLRNNAEPEEALAVLRAAQGETSRRNRAIQAACLAQVGQRRGEAEQLAERAGLAAYRAFWWDRRGGESSDTYKERWEAGIAATLSDSSPIALNQAAQVALQRGHFTAAERLIARGLAIEPASLPLRFSDARLWHERRQFDRAREAWDRMLRELAGQENWLVRYAHLDTELELWNTDRRKVTEPVPNRLHETPRSGTIRLTAPFLRRALGLQLKAIHYGVQEWKGGWFKLKEKVERLAGKEPALWNQLARMELPQATQLDRLSLAAEAIRLSAGHSRIVSLNNAAELLRESAPGEALKRLEESLGLDPDNSYTLALMAEVLALVGESARAADVAARTRLLRDGPATV
jgi:predicted Zn-dependent protease